MCRGRLTRDQQESIRFGLLLYRSETRASLSHLPGRDFELRKYEARVQWLAKIVKDRKVRELVPEAKDLDVDVYVLPNLGAVNIVIHGLLGDGVAASTRFDPQAKGLGEWVRSRIVHIQEDLL